MLFRALVNSAGTTPEVVGTVTNTGSDTGEANVDLSSLDIKSGDMAVFSFAATLYASSVDDIAISGWTTEAEAFDNSVLNFVHGVYSKQLAGTETTVTVTTTGESSPYAWVASCTVFRFVRNSTDTGINTGEGANVTAAVGDVLVAVESAPGDDNDPQVGLQAGYTSLANLSETTQADTSGSANLETVYADMRVGYKIATSNGSESISPAADTVVASLTKIEGYG